jgi:integrase
MYITPLSQPDTLTVQAAIQIVATWTDLDAAKRRDLASALSTAARMAGLPAGTMPLTPASLRQHVLTRYAATFGITQGSMRNIRSRLNFVLRRLGLIAPKNIPLTAAWQALFSPLTVRERGGMSAFAAYCSHRDISPEAVTAATFADFAAHLETQTLNRAPRKRIGDLRSDWNRFSRTVPGWPANQIPKPPRKGDYVLPEDAFLESFRVDLHAFGAQLGGNILYDDFLDDDAAESDDPAPLRNLKPSRAISVALRLSHGRWAASALVATGVPVTEVPHLASLITPLTRARDILRFQFERAGRKPSAAGMHVAEVLHIIAKYHVRVSEKALAQIKAWSKPVKLSYLGMTEKNEWTILQVLTPAREQKLLELPDALMSIARSLLAESPAQAASLALRAVTIEILLSCPLRLGNLRGLRFDWHLHRDDCRGSLISAILLQPNEVKNEKPIIVRVSTRIGRLIEEWITKFRGVIASPDCLYLFPGHGTGNQPIGAQGLRDAIKRATAEYVGVAITPHQFRHLAARRFLAVHQGHHEEVRQFLCHKSIETTTKTYCGSDTTSALGRLDEVIADRRKTLRKRPAGQRSLKTGMTRAQKPPGGR